MDDKVVTEWFGRVTLILTVLDVDVDDGMRAIILTTYASMP